LWLKGNTISNNFIHHVDDYAIYVRYNDSISIKNNIIDSVLGTTGYGVYLFDNVNFYVESNDIKVPYYGIYMSDANLSTDITPTRKSTLINNMVVSETYYGIYFDDVEEANVFHNSVLNKSVGESA